MSQQKLRVNQEIRVPEVRVIGEDGEQFGVLSVKEALRVAEEKDLDLIEIAPQAAPPVCKLMNYGKFLYEIQKKEKLQKKKQQVVVLKEIRLHPNTDTHDFDFKARHAVGFIEDGNKVKVSVLFKGRELAYTDLGRNLLEKFIDRLSEVAKTEHDIKFEGRAMYTILTPSKIKKKN